MSIIRKYAFVLSLAVAVIYIYAPLSLKDAAKPPWLRQASIVDNKLLASAKRDVVASAVDPIDAGLVVASAVDPMDAGDVDAHLDHRIVQWIGSLEGWRTFLGNAQSARAVIDKLTPPEPPLAPAVAELPNDAPADTKAPGDAASPGPPPAESEIPGLASDEICRRDRDRLEQLFESRASDEGLRFLSELGCEGLRPQLFRLTERLDYETPTGADPPGPSSKVGSAPVAKWRAAEARGRKHWAVSVRGFQPKRRANRSPSLPTILLALFGDEQGSSTAFRRIRTGGGAGANGMSLGFVGGASSTGGATGGVAAGGVASAGSASSGGNSGGGDGNGHAGGDGDGNGNGHGGGGGNGGGGGH